VAQLAFLLGVEPVSLLSGPHTSVLYTNAPTHREAVVCSVVYR
jgi:hypothetical protein